MTFPVTSLDNNDSVGIRIRRARQVLGLTQKEFAAAIGVSYRVLQDYEGKDVIPGGLAFAGMAKLGLNLNWLVTGTGSLCQVPDQEKAVSDLVIDPDLAGAADAVSQLFSGLGVTPTPTARERLVALVYLELKLHARARKTSKK